MPSGGNVLVDDAIELVDSLTALVGQPFTPFPILKTNARQPVYGIRLKVTG